MATYFDPKFWSPMRAVDFGKRLLGQSWLEQWLSRTTAWVDPVADLSAGTVTALLPDTLMTVLSEGILSRFGGHTITITLLGHELTGTLELLKVRRHGAYFQSKTVLTELRWDTHPIEELTVVAHRVRLIPGVPTKVRADRLDIEGAVTTAALADWLNTRQHDWVLTVRENGLIRAVHQRRRIIALIDLAVVGDQLYIDVHRASWFGMRVPRSLRTPTPIQLPGLPHDARIEHVTRDGDLVRFRLELDGISGSFDLAQIRSAIVAGTTLIVF